MNPYNEENAAAEIAALGTENDRLRDEVGRLRSYLAAAMKLAAERQVENAVLRHAYVALAALLPWAENWLPDEALERGALVACQAAREALKGTDP